MIDVFADKLDLAELGFSGIDPKVTGRPSYHPSILLKLYIYGYLNRVQSSRRLKREAGRNGGHVADGTACSRSQTIADFRKDNGTAIRQVCGRFIALCRTMGLLAEAGVAIDGSKFKAVNNRDKNFTRAKMERRIAQIKESVARYLHQLDTADRQETSLARTTTKTTRLKEKIEKLKEQMQRLKDQRENARHAGPADIADRSRCPLDGDERPRFRRCRLHRAGRRRHHASSDRHARGDQCRERPVAARPWPSETKETLEGRASMSSRTEATSQRRNPRLRENGIAVTLPSR